MSKLTRVREGYVLFKSTLAGAIERLLSDKAEDIKTGLDFGMVRGEESSDGLQALIDTAGMCRIPKGSYTIGKTVGCDFSGDFPILGRDSKRFNLEGDGYNSTTLNFNGSFDCLNFTADSGHAGQLSGSIKDLTVYGTGNKGIGMRLHSVHHMDLENLLFQRCDIGLRIHNSLVGRFKNVRAQYNNQGIYIDTDDTTSANAEHFIIHTGQNTQVGVGGTVGTSISFKESTVEHNGLNDNSGGGIHLTVKEPGCVISIKDSYIGFNGGEADIFITNDTNGTIIVDISDTFITRGSPDGKFTKYNIRIFNKKERGWTKLNLHGVNFFDNSAWGYEPSAERPYIYADERTIISGIETCSFNFDVPKGTIVRSSVGATTGVVESDGRAISLARGWLCQREDAGKYLITAPYPLSNDKDGYTVMAISESTNSDAKLSKVVGQVEKIDTTKFRIHSYLLGTPGQYSDCRFNFAVFMAR